MYQNILQTYIYEFWPGRPSGLSLIERGCRRHHLAVLVQRGGRHLARQNAEAAVPKQGGILVIHPGIMILSFLLLFLLKFDSSKKLILVCYKKNIFQADEGKLQESRISLTDLSGSMWGNVWRGWLERCSTSILRQSFFLSSFANTWEIAVTDCISFICKISLLCWNENYFCCKTCLIDY